MTHSAAQAIRAHPHATAQHHSGVRPEHASAMFVAVARKFLASREQMTATPVPR